MCEVTAVWKRRREYLKVLIKSWNISNCKYKRFQLSKDDQPKEVYKLFRRCLWERWKNLFPPHKLVWISFQDISKACFPRKKSAFTELKFNFYKIFEKFIIKPAIAKNSQRKVTAAKQRERWEPQPTKGFWKIARVNFSVGILLC